MELLQAFGIDYKILLAQLVNFAILFFVLYKVGYKPIFTFLEDRKRKIASGITMAEKAEAELRAATEEKSAILIEAKKEADALITKAREIAEQKKKEMLDSAQSTAQDIVAIAKTQAITEKEKIVNDARQDIIDLSFALAQKALSQRIGDKEDRELIKNIIGK